MRMEKSNFTVKRMARLLEVSRSGFYAWMKREPSKRAVRRERIEKKMVWFHGVSDETYGASRILADLRDDGETVSRKTVATAMRCLGLAGLAHIVLRIGGFVMVFPFLWQIVMSLSSIAEVTSVPPTFFPAELRFDNYLTVFATMPFFNQLAISILITVIRTVVQAMRARVPVIAVLGGATGEFVAHELAADGGGLTRVGGSMETRICISIASTADGSMTEFYERATPVSGTEWESVTKAALRVLPQRPGWLAVSGSVPASLDAGTLARLVELGMDAGLSVAIDSHGAPFGPAVDAGAALVKVNRAEDAALLGGDSGDDILELATAIYGRSTGIVVVTDGINGSVATDGRESWRVSPSDAAGGFRSGVAVRSSMECCLPSTPVPTWPMHSVWGRDVRPRTRSNPEPPASIRSRPV